MGEASGPVYSARKLHRLYIHQTVLVVCLVKNLISLILAAFITLPVIAEEWKTLVWLPHLKITQDQSTVNVEGRVISAWQRWTFNEDQVFKGVTYRVGKYHIYADCEHNTRSNAQVELLNEKGEVVFSQKGPVFVFAPLLPGSIPEAVHKRICVPS